MSAIVTCCASNADREDANDAESFSEELAGRTTHRSTMAAERPSDGVRLPTLEDIGAFMLRYSAHLPSPLLTDDVPTHKRRDDDKSAAGAVKRAPWSSHSCRMPPYLYTGTDYALVLAACFPTRCINLALLNWSADLLTSQRQGNLRVFCEAARALLLPDTPLSALHADLLQSHPSCVVSHLKVQHWLYSLSLRFAPAADHDAAALRAVHRHMQLGEPYLKRSRAESPQVERGEATCRAVSACLPFSAADLQRCCAPALAEVPPFTEALRGTGSGDVGASGDKESALGASGAKASSSTAAQTGDESASTTRQKPWLNYSKPWLLPSLRAAEAKRVASEAAAAKREQEERERNPRYTAFAGVSQHVQEQYAMSRAAAAEARAQLRVLKAVVVQDIMEGKPIDFRDIAGRLRDRC